MLDCSSYYSLYNLDTPFSVAKVSLFLAFPIYFATTEQ